MTRWIGFVVGALGYAMICVSSAADPNLFGGPRSELLPEHQLGCIMGDEARNDYTPPDFMDSYAKCGVAGRYADAMELRLFAGAYSYFDSLRVLDPTSHNAFTVLIQYYAPRSQDFEGLRAAGQKYADLNSPQSKKFCKDLLRIGPPSYYPTYMITHGLGAYTSKDKPTKEIDVQAAWKDTVEKWARCTPSKQP